MYMLTREAIKKSYLKLLNRGPMDRITVKAIVEDCGVNRNTFYYHFSDIPALLNEIVTDLADQIISRKARTDSLEACLGEVTRFARENKRAVMNIYRSSSKDVYEKHLIKICGYFVSSYIDSVWKNLPISDEDRDVMIRFYQCELIGQVLVWLESDMSYDKGQFKRIIELRGSLRDAFLERQRADRTSE